MVFVVEDLHRRLRALKDEKVLLRRIEAKLVAEVKKGQEHFAEALSYVKERKVQLAFEEAGLLVRLKRSAT